MNTHSQYPFRSTGHSDDGNSTGDGILTAVSQPAGQKIIPMSMQVLTHTKLKQDPNAYILNMQVRREGTLLLTS